MSDSNTTLDSKCITIVKIEDNGSSAIYEFSSTVWKIDTESPGKRMKCGTAVGSLMIYRTGGKVHLLKSMPGDLDWVRFSRARSVLKKHFAKNEFPDQTGFVSR